jgi:S1-C subfamily serine protease
MPKKDIYPMKYKYFFAGLYITCILLSCAPKITYRELREPLRPKNQEYEIKVYKDSDHVPANSFLLGVLRIDDSGVSVGCGFDDVMELAKEKAKKVGADAVYITKILLPDKTSTCYRIEAVLLGFKAISDWPSIFKDELQIRKYLDSINKDSAMFEGIYNICQSGVDEDIYSGQLVQYNDVNIYRIAIIRDTTHSNYDYVGFVLESKYPEWQPGFIKARFRNTSYESVYESIWYYGNFEEESCYFTAAEDGSISSQYSQNTEFYKSSATVTFIKAYPPTDKTLITLPHEANNDTITGSAFFLNNDGLLVSNYHIIANKQNYEVTLPIISKSYKAKVLLKDENNDLVILKLDEFEFDSAFKMDIPYIINLNQPPKVGQSVYTVGYPLEPFLGKEAKLTTGVISALSGVQQDPRLLQISNPIQPGNSGSPLLDYDGKLIGIVNASLNAAYLYDKSDIIPLSINFAIKANYLKSLIDLLPGDNTMNNRPNLLSGKSLEDQVELVNPYVVIIKAW